MASKEGAGPHGSRARSPAASEYSRTNSRIGSRAVVHRQSAAEKPWKGPARSGRQKNCPQLWRVVWRLIKRLQNGGISSLRQVEKSSLSAAWDAAMLANPKATKQRSVRESGAANRADGGRPLERRLGSAPRSAERHDLPDLVWRGGRRRPRRRCLCGRLPERLHTRMDRGALSRPDPGGRARFRRRFTACAAPGGRASAAAGDAVCRERPTRTAVGCPSAPPRDRPARRGRRHQPEVHVRFLRDRLVEPLRACRGARRRGSAGAGLQPALHLRPHGAREDPPLARGRELRHRSRRRADLPVRDLGDFHERLHQQPPRQAHRGLQAALPHLRRPVDRRRAVLRAQGADPGGVLPHVQLPLRGRPADHHVERPAATRDLDARGTAALAFRVGPDHRYPAARPRDTDRDPAQEGEERPDRDPRPGDPHVHRVARVDEHPRARGSTHACRRVLVADRPAPLGRARAGRPQGLLPAGRGDTDLDRADPGVDLRALRRHPRRADRRAPLAEHRLPAAGRDVPLTRAHGLLAPEDRQGIRWSRPHDSHPRDLEDCTPDP